MSDFSGHLNRLHSVLAGNSFVRLWSCAVGQNPQFMRRLAGMIGVPVWASTSPMTAYGYNTGGEYAVCDPLGNYCKGQTFPS
jgi:hypothetical protein